MKRGGKKKDRKVYDLVKDDCLDLMFKTKQNFHDSRLLQKVTSLYNAAFFFFLITKWPFNGNELLSEIQHFHFTAWTMQIKSTETWL